MDRTQVVSRVKIYIQRAQNDGTAEDPNFDFKREWMKLTEEKGLYEFLKDTAAMVNTLGDDGIIVFGFDDKKKEFHKAVFSDCGLRDETDLNNKISSMIDRPFPVYLYDEEIDGNPVSIIHIPYSSDKPHVVRKYKKISDKNEKSPELENVVFVRRGTASRIANKFELDQMFFDRMHLLPDYRVFVSRLVRVYNISHYGDIIQWSIRISIENAGSRIIGVDTILFNAIISDLPDTQWACVNIIKLAPDSRDERKIEMNQIRIAPNSIFDGQFLLNITPDSLMEITSKGFYKNHVELSNALQAADKSTMTIKYYITLTSNETLRGTVG